MEGTTELDGVKYKYEYILSNNLGEFSLNDSSVELLQIDESLLDPFLKGKIIISNPVNFLDTVFLYRGDGSDTIKILLYPEDDDSKKIEMVGTIIEEINYVDTETPIKNRKLYSFVDSDMSLLNSTFAYGVKAVGKADKMLRDLLELFKFEIDEDKFEENNFTLDRFPGFIAPSLNFRYLDLINYILQYNYVKDGDLNVKSILKKENGKYKFFKISDLFKDNKKLVYESFNSGDLVSDPKVNKNNPLPESEYKIYPSSTPLYVLNNPDKQVSNTFFMNSLVVSYDHILGSSKMSEIRLDDTREKWKKKFVDIFDSIGGDTKMFLNLTKNKKEGEFKIYRLPFTHSQNVGIVEADLVNNFIFFNQTLFLSTIGDLGRKAGLFIDIFNLLDHTTANNKPIGRWLIVNSSFIKTGKNLKSEINCVKTYVGPTLKYKDA